MKLTIFLDIGKDFSPYLGPRYSEDGEYSGQEYRDTILIPAFKDVDEVVVSFDRVKGYGSGFLEEVFGGMVRRYGLEAVRNKIHLRTTNRPFLHDRIDRYMEQAEENRNGN